MCLWRSRRHTMRPRSIKPTLQLVPIYAGRVLEIPLKARCLKSHATCSAPQYELPPRDVLELPSYGVLAIFAFGVNYLLLQRQNGGRVALMEMRVWRGRTKISHILSRIFYRVLTQSSQGQTFTAQRKAINSWLKTFLKVQHAHHCS